MTSRDGRSSEFTFNGEVDDDAISSDKNESNAFSKLSSYDTNEFKSIASLPAAHKPSKSEVKNKSMVEKLNSVIVKVEADIK